MLKTKSQKRMDYLQDQITMLTSITSGLTTIAHAQDTEIRELRAQVQKLQAERQLKPTKLRTAAVALKKAPDKTAKLLTTRQLADVTGYHARTIRGMVAAGTLTPVNMEQPTINGRRAPFLFDQAAVEQLKKRPKGRWGK